MKKDRNGVEPQVDSQSDCSVSDVIEGEYCVCLDCDEVIWHEDEVFEFEGNCFCNEECAQNWAANI